MSAIKKKAPPLRLLVGLVVLCLGLVLVPIGIYIYLEGPSMMGVRDLVTRNQYSPEIYAGKSTWLSFDMNRTQLASLIVSFALDADIRVEGGALDLRIMNSSSYHMWKSQLSQTREAEYVGITQLHIHFTPPQNDTFYLVFDNTRYANDKHVFVNYELTRSIILYDFSAPFTALEAAAVGFLFMVVATPLGNPANRLLQYSLVRYRLLLGAGSIESMEETKQYARYSTRTFWIALVVLISAWLLAVAWGLGQFRGAELWILQIVYDIWIRFALFFLSLILIPLALWLIVGVLIGDAAAVLAKRALGLRQQAELSILHMKFFWRSWYRPDSVLALVLSCAAISLAVVNRPPLQSLLMLFGVSIVALASGRNAYLSFDRAHRQLKLRKTKDEFWRDRLLNSVLLTSGIWNVVLFLLAWRWAYTVSLPSVASVLTKTGPIAKVQGLYDVLFGGVIHEVLRVISLLNSDYLVFIIWSLALMGIAYAYIMPNLFVTRLRKRFARRSMSAIIIFLFSFASQLLLYMLVPQYVASNIMLFGLISALTAGIAWFMERTYEDALNKG